MLSAAKISRQVVASDGLIRSIMLDTNYTDNWLMRNKPNKLIKTEVRWILKPRICYVAAKHELDPSYPAKIDAFKKAFNTLNEVWGLSETPKVHIVLQHLGEYLDSAKETLWTCSDENVEACHQFQESKISLMQRTNISKLNFQNLSQWTIMHFYVHQWNIPNFEHWIWIYFVNMFLFLFYLFRAIFLSSCRHVSKCSGPPEKLICLLWHNFP